MSAPLRLAVALDGAGWHPAAWQLPGARPRDLLTTRYWADLVREAEAGGIDLVTIEDSFSPVLDGRTDRVRGSLDAVLIAAAVAPLTRRIGLVPSAHTTHTEPFHVAKAIATLDFASGGRAGWRPVITDRPADAAAFGRRELPADPIPDLHDEAAEHIEVVRRLWDSWEDDAEIRDAATGRFIDRAKLHHIDFRGRWFSVRGPSITPRPPQGQPPVVVLAGTAPADAADVVITRPRDAGDITRQDGRLGFADLTVFLDADRRARLDDLDGAFTSDAAVFTGTPAALADLITTWHAAGADGVRLRPGALPHDLTAITRGLVPELRARGVVPREPADPGTLRGLLGLDRPANRYALEGS